MGEGWETEGADCGVEGRVKLALAYREDQELVLGEISFGLEVLERLVLD